MVNYTIQNTHGYFELYFFILASRLQSVMDLSTKFRQQAYELR
jgi:hypothetical protein